jgi:prephenate dehydratase
MIRDEGLRDAGAVASRRAAEIYCMTVLAEGIEDNKENYTRFLQVGRGSTRPTGRDRTSIAFTVANEPGTLVAALHALADRGLNLSKIESRPYAGRPWEYVFFIDFDGHAEDSVAAGAIRDLAKYAGSLKVLGSYPRA